MLTEPVSKLLVSISRSSFYYQPKGPSKANLALMERIDRLFTKCPFYGSCQMVRALAHEGFKAALQECEEGVGESAHLTGTSCLQDTRIELRMVHLPYEPL